jgi:hypothetical protein
MVDWHATGAELGRYPPVPIAAAMLDDDLLNRVAHPQFLFTRMTPLEKAKKPGAADLGHAAHRLYTKAALRRHQFPDAVSPEPVPV